MPLLDQFDVSIVIVSWNAKSLLAKCLQSLSECCSRVRCEVIVVDNASTDGSGDMIATEFPWVTLISNSSNLGFAKANNIGIAHASGEYICLVNSDVRFVHDCLSPMLAYMREHPDVGLLGPQMLDSDHHVRRSTMRFPTIWNSVCRALALDSVFRRSKFFGGFLATDFDHKHTADVEVLNGWFWMARRAALAMVGLLDERFFFYGEDIDWSYRFHRAGWRCVFLAEAAAIHYGGGSSLNAPIKFQIQLYRANGQYWRKHHGRSGCLCYLFIAWLHQGLRVLGYLPTLAGKRKRAENTFKVKRSLACMAWMMGLYRPELSRNTGSA